MNPDLTAGVPKVTARLLSLFAGAAVVWLYWPWLRDPFLRYDDFNFLTRSRTWTEFAAHVWEPMNDHAMPMSRLAAALLMQCASTPSLIPRLAAIQGVAAVLLGMWLVQRFVSRELGHTFFGIVAMTIWGVTSAYYECVTWYSASFFILSLDTIVVALVAAQSWREKGSWIALTTCVVCCALAPGWYAGGVLAGPVCALYLLFAPATRASSRMSWRRALAPLAGTFAFLAISLPRTASAIIHATHYQGRTVFQAFSPIAGVENTLRTLADNQVVGALGIYRATAFDWPAVLVIDAALIVLTIALWRIVAMKSLLVVGIAFILGSDLLVYSARADWSYVNQVHRWTRYHLFPHLGLALVLIAGLTGARPHLLRLLPNNRLTTMQTIGIAVLIAALSLAHVSRAAGSHIHIAEAGDLMRQLDRLEDACRRYGISGDTARAALDFRQMPVGYRGDNAFDLLRCSPNPRPMSRDEAAAVLRSVQ